MLYGNGSPRRYGNGSGSLNRAADDYPQTDEATDPQTEALLKAAAESDIDMRILHDDLVYFIAKEKQKEDRRHLQRKKRSRK